MENESLPFQRRMGKAKNVIIIFEVILRSKSDKVKKGVLQIVLIRINLTAVVKMFRNKNMPAPGRKNCVDDKPMALS